MGLSNLPPNVSGNEDEIAGPRKEIETLRYCPICDAEVEGLTQVWRYGRVTWSCNRHPDDGTDVEEYEPDWDRKNDAREQDTTEQGD